MVWRIAGISSRMVKTPAIVASSIKRIPILWLSKLDVQSGAVAALFSVDVLRSSELPVALSQKFVEAEANKNGTEDVESDASEFGLSRVAGKDAARIERCGMHEDGLKWMVDPFAEPGKKATKRNDGGWNGWKRGKQTSACRQENHDASDHKYLIPVIKGKFRKWIVHTYTWLCE